MSDLKPGKYRMTVEVEVDEEGYLLPHDSGEMFMADWWVQNEATFEPVPPPQCNECGWWLTTNPASCPSCGAPTGLGVSGEGQSEPTPAPREPRVWPTTHTAEPDSVRKVCDDEGDPWDRGTDGLWHSHDDWEPMTWAELMHEYGPLTEVVTPEGTP